MIKFFPLHNIKKMAFEEYARNFMEQAAECPTVKERMTKQFARLEAAYEQVQILSARIMKSDLTVPIAVLDARQDGLYTAFYHAVNAQRKSFDEEISWAATSLWNTLNSIRVRTNMQYLQQLAKIDLLTHYIDQHQMEYVERLGLASLYATMKETTLALHSTIDERQDERVKKPDGSFRKARRQFEAEYTRFVNYVNAYNLVLVVEAEQPDEALHHFISVANVNIALFMRTQFRKSSH